MTNLSWQDEPWAEFSTLEVAACHATHLQHSIAIRSNLELKTRPKQLLGSLPLDIALSSTGHCDYDPKLQSKHVYITDHRSQSHKTFCINLVTPFCRLGLYIAVKQKLIIYYCILPLYVNSILDINTLNITSRATFPWRLCISAKT